MSSDLSSLVSRLESVTTRLEGLASGGQLASGEQGSSENVDAFDSGVMGGKIKTYFDLSKKIGGEVSEQATLVKKAFDEQREILVKASQYKQPNKEMLPSLTKALSSAVGDVVAFCEKRRASKQFNHLKAVSDGIGCVGWVTVSPKPGSYIKETFDQALFYSNRVIKEYKGKDDTHVDWARGYTAAIKELKEYVDDYYKSGLVWNPSGGVWTSAGAAPPPPAGAGPPPPPPPAIQPPTTSSGGGGDETAAQRANLFASINKGGDVTKGLRKVTDNMKTHKNPNLRASSVVKAQEKPAASKPAPKYGAATGAKKKPPVLELQGKKWVVENQDDQSNLSITNTNSKQSVYVYKCNKSTLKVSGKVNSIVLDSCKRMALVFDGVIAACEVLNCQSVQVQITGQCPTVSIDKTDGCQVFLSKDSLNAVIVSAKSSEMNVCVPGKVEGDFNEFALPEQYRTTWNGKGFVTNCTDING